MISPPEEITVRCPKCGHLYKDWTRASVNLDLDDFDEEYLADRLCRRPDWVIGDFGCGECLLGNAIPNKVEAFDHVAVNDHVTACDMRKTPCENESLNAAVFCLSLVV